ncbi:hypothetical protein GCM10009574_067500 [Streptomyces asiaticus]|uniref:Uncharacterized protein n=2 Tax=Streptomyces rhizosphaericus TaxID=114699 RepID=A0ABN1SK72_9ACTN
MARPNLARGDAEHFPVSLDVAVGFLVGDHERDPGQAHRPVGVVQESRLVNEVQPLDLCDANASLGSRILL